MLWRKLTAWLTFALFLVPLPALAADPIVVCTHAQTPEAILAAKVIAADDLSRCEELGAALAAGLAMGIF